MLRDDLAALIASQSNPLFDLDGARADASTRDALGRLERTSVSIAPLLRLHPDDDYRTSSIRFYLPRVSLGVRLEAVSLDKVRNVVRAGELNRDKLLRRRRAQQDSSVETPTEALVTDWCLYIRDAFKSKKLDLGGLEWNAYKEVTRRGSVEGTQTYLHIRPAGQGAPGVDFQYWFFYPYNPAILGFEHEGDWEHVTIRVDDADTISDAFFAAHDAEGKWFGADKLDFAADHLVAYSAHETHASYPTAGKIVRDGLPDDETGTGGPEVECWNNLVLVGLDGRVVDAEEWMCFTGRWGRNPKGPHGPAFQAAWTGDA